MSGVCGMASILVVDDAPDLLRLVRRGLEADGHTVLTTDDGAEGLRLGLTMKPDLTILDLVMPGVDGRAVLSGMLASDPTARVVVLSGRAETSVRVECLDRGAIDFLPKPFALRELTARVRSQLRSQRTHDESADVIDVSGLRLDLQTRELSVGGRIVDLTRREFLLLRHLMRSADKVCTRDELLSEVWGYPSGPETNVVDVCVARLRAKLRTDCIDTIRHIGYRLHSV